MWFVESFYRVHTNAKNNSEKDNLKLLKKIKHSLWTFLGLGSYLYAAIILISENNFENKK